MEHTFPLLKLPDTVILQVLQNTELTELLIISLFSSKTKSLVTSLGLRYLKIEINISDEISLTLDIGTFKLILSFHKDSNDPNSRINYNRPVAASYQIQNDTFQLSAQFNFKDWLSHIRTVFWYDTTVDVIFKLGCELFEIKWLKSLKKYIKNVNRLSMEQAIADTRTEEILQGFKVSEELILSKNPFEDLCQIQEFFIRNYKNITYFDTFSLDDLLVVNSEIVQFDRSTTLKQFNRFVKHWIRGSNPRLQYMDLLINITDSASREVFLKGIHSVDVAEEEQQEVANNCPSPFGVHVFGCDMVRIRRGDGKPAVITTKNFENLIFISFIVFP